VTLLQQALAQHDLELADDLVELGMADMPVVLSDPADLREARGR